MNPVSEITRLRKDIFIKVARWALSNSKGSKPTKKDITALVMGIVPEGPARYRCCIHKERAVARERLMIATGLQKSALASQPIVVISEACNGCSLVKYVVTDACQKCIAHPCQNSCPKKCISVIQNRAYIDQAACIECGKCAKACPYHAIVEISRPCERVCAVKAIKVDDSRRAILDNERCVSCGMCVSVCPFGAITDTSSIVEIIYALRNKRVPKAAIIAPSIAGQFGPKVTPGHIKTALFQLGFDIVTEAALGADQTSKLEAHELLESPGKLMANSCCYPFAKAVAVTQPDLQQYLSSTLSPMRSTGKTLKDRYHNDITTVFIGPCMGKKSEATLGPEIDYVMTFEELSALLSASNIDPADLQPSDIYDASSAGRLFARSGGVVSAVISNTTGVQVEAVQAQGIIQSLAALKAAANKDKAGDYTFVECMACEGGCVGGPGTLVTPAAAVRALEKYAKDDLSLAAMK